MVKAAQLTLLKQRTEQSDRLLKKQEVKKERNGVIVSLEKS
jgi:hypothetical protein